MSGPAYREFRPRWYRRRVSTWWWLGDRRYLAFILRELSSVFVALFVLLTLLQLWALSRGPGAWADLQAALRTPFALAVNAVGFLFVMFHAVTWFALAPRAMVIHVAGRRVPGAAVAAGNYVAWVAASAFVAWWILGG